MDQKLFIKLHKELLDLFDREIMRSRVEEVMRHRNELGVELGTSGVAAAEVAKALVELHARFPDMKTEETSSGYTVVM